MVQRGRLIQRPADRFYLVILVVVLGGWAIHDLRNGDWFSPITRTVIVIGGGLWIHRRHVRRHGPYRPDADA